MTKAEEHLLGMLQADLVLYEKCTDTPGFAFHFNQLAVLARGAERAREEKEVCPFEDKLRRMSTTFVDIWRKGDAQRRKTVENTVAELLSLAARTTMFFMREGG